MTDGGDAMLFLAVLLATVAMLSVALLRGWEDWLHIRRLELDQSGQRPPRAAARQRLELIDLKDRVKRLEAIADGSDS